MKTLHIMVGLPRSGKSTKASELGIPIVSTDAIRLALHGSRWRADSEPMVWAIAHTMVEALFLSGHEEVVLDSCNVSARLRREWESIKWNCNFHVINIPKHICVQRAVAAGMDDLIPVIERMANSWDVPGMGRDS
jgi:predicted kinase